MLKEENGKPRVAPRFLSLLDAVAGPLCGVASGTHRKSGVIVLTSNASPVESYLLPSAYPLLTPRREKLQELSKWLGLKVVGR